MKIPSSRLLITAPLLLMLLNCASPEQKALRHLEQVVRILESNCKNPKSKSAERSAECLNPDKAGRDIRGYYKEHGRDFNEIKRALQEKEAKLRSDPKKLHAWEEKYRDRVTALTKRIATLMKAYPNLRANKAVRDALDLFAGSK